ncbi:MAG: NAD-dependent epimerase/dehydratase family protein [Microbacterium sp.]|uniref:NAD-dependent epimerase/dehydratase family protein n=1 Tax=Microbacterium sp. TaxID=51671 RepID=UPI00272360E3|nr:NAD-dependent epimerase/dehydratase family protein [Microbacterium sp.]MDO8383035.1 NAD-dependent epimerase/dehydratase family protein [Microbacterium sp.]
MAAELHLVIGAGPVGTSVAHRLARDGRRVRLVTRSGSGPEHPLIQRVAADASDSAALAVLAKRATVIYNCANPGSYPQWKRVWPPLAASILRAAESSGAVLVTLGNLYGYGPVTVPITRDMPLRPTDPKGALRARIWEEALASHEAGRVRATEARASDYIGPTAPARSSVLAFYANATLADRMAWVFADPDQPHSWTAVNDIAATLITLGTDRRAWGSPWLVPSSAPVSTREVLSQLARIAGAGEPRLRRIPRGPLHTAGFFVPTMRELRGVLYQFDAPFAVDASATTDTFGLTASPWRKVLARTAPIWRERALVSRTA